MIEKYLSIGIQDKEKRRNYLHYYVCKRCLKNKCMISHRKIEKITKFCSFCWGAVLRNKPVSFRYYNSSEIETFPSITLFCKNHPELGKNAKYHFAEVLKGRKLHYKGWLLANNKEKINISDVKIIKTICIKDFLNS